MYRIIAVEMSLSCLALNTSIYRLNTLVIKITMSYNSVFGSSEDLRRIPDDPEPCSLHVCFSPEALLRGMISPRALPDPDHLGSHSIIC